MKLERHRDETEIPTASMADIAFLLIIFFMLTSAFAATRGIDFRMPEDEEKSADHGEPGVSIRVKSEGDERWSLIVDRRAMTVAELLPYVDSQLRRTPDKPVLLYTDPEAPYSGMIAIYDELLKAESVTGRRIETPPITTQWSCPLTA